MGVVLAAYLVVVQATLTGMMLGAQAAPRADAFADVLCSSSGASGEPAEHTGLPDCCVVGCPMLGGGSAPTPGASFAPPPLAIAPVASAPAAFASASRSPDASPRSTRAPPLTA